MSVEREAMLIDRALGELAPEAAARLETELDVRDPDAADYRSVARLLGELGEETGLSDEVGLLEAVRERLDEEPAGREGPARVLRARGRSARRRRPGRAPRRGSLLGSLARAAAIAALAVSLYYAYPYLRRYAPGPEAIPVGRPAAGRALGEVLWADGGAAWKSAADSAAQVALAPGLSLADGDRVRVGPRTWARIRLTDGSQIEFKAGTEAQLRAAGDAGGREIELRSGAVYLEMVPSSQEAVLRVRTAAAVAEVLGTRFEVAAEAGRTELKVAQGRVSFAGRSAANRDQPGRRLAPRGGPGGPAPLRERFHRGLAGGFPHRGPGDRARAVGVGRQAGSAAADEQHPGRPRRPSRRAGNVPAAEEARFHGLHCILAPEIR